MLRTPFVFETKVTNNRQSIVLLLIKQELEKVDQKINSETIIEQLKLETIMLLALTVTVAFNVRG